MSPIALLGPQRLRPLLGSAADRLDVHGPVATITAGWQEREPEDEELRQHLGRPVVRLELYRRHEEILIEDTEFAEAFVALRAEIRRLKRWYRSRLAHAQDAARELLRRTEDDRFLVEEQDAAVKAIRTLDEGHLARLAVLIAQFRERTDLDHRPSIVRRRDEVRALLETCPAVAIAGGHVGVLLDVWRLFDLGTLIGARPVIAWSAGAMVLSERIVLFHDSPPQGAGNAEMLDTGAGRVPGIVVLPHARRRLRLADRMRVSLFARRFSPRTCIAMDEGEWIVVDGNETTVESAPRRLLETGLVEAATTLGKRDS